MKKHQSKIFYSFDTKLYYQPPYHWQHLQSFFAARIIKGLEWCDEHSYGRTFNWRNKQERCKGRFTAYHNEKKHYFNVKIEIDNVHLLKSVTNNIQRILDLDAQCDVIEKRLASSGLMNSTRGLRLPGIWSVLEAGIRAILGQQISVVAACNLVTQLTNELGKKTKGSGIYFPSANCIAESDLSFLKIPGKRKETLHNLAQHYISAPDPNAVDHWLALKGIGSWTVDYTKMRGLSDPDIYLGGDLGIKKAMAQSQKTFDPKHSSPFRSYLTFQLWNQL